MKNDNIARSLVQIYRLRKERPKRLPLADLAVFRRKLKEIWKSNFPRARYESNFMKQTTYHPTTLTNGYIARRQEGVEVVLHGNAEDHRPVWLVFNLPYEGRPTLTSKCEISPREGGSFDPSRRVFLETTFAP